VKDSEDVGNTVLCQDKVTQTCMVTGKRASPGSSTACSHAFALRSG